MQMYTETMMFCELQRKKKKRKVPRYTQIDHSRLAVFVTVHFRLLRGLVSIIKPAVNAILDSSMQMYARSAPTTRILVPQDEMATDSTAGRLATKHVLITVTNTLARLYRCIELKPIRGSTEGSIVLLSVEADAAKNHT